MNSKANTTDSDASAGNEDETSVGKNKQPKKGGLPPFVHQMEHRLPYRKEASLKEALVDEQDAIRKKIREIREMEEAIANKARSEYLTQALTQAQKRDQGQSQ